ncbi:hypothetical protein [Salinibacterium sp. SWN167]|uniref:hypothetical protein n=1 Tax=Salinibacterium sp. SWN167 TaxID=2792054 RepID=UPI0018CF5B9D|nr:hypothetical protein [Salinibacterium sp. SWN167]MBH0082391.1 hypothetical protein [Salinibacterium sp. SWN167]
MVRVTSSAGSSNFVGGAIFSSRYIHVAVGNTEIPENEGEGTGSGGAAETANGDEVNGGFAGTGDGTDGGRRGGPLGDASNPEEERTRWPRRGSAESQRCEPYEEEKSLEQIAATRPEISARLAERIVAIASALEIDQCNYAGHFAISAARAIGAIAHSIGLAARQNAGTATVIARPNGGGNNGVIDIEVEVTPGLLYLKALADLVAEVEAFYQLVHSLYTGMGDRGAVQYATSWGIDFLIEASDSLEASCAHLFAETCRVVLMQQLESTRETLANRSGSGLDDTVRHFDSALGILGERIVATELLQRALRRSGQLGRTGSASDILSAPVPPTPRDHYSEIGYSPPRPYVLAPITEAERLALVDGAHVVQQTEGRRIQWRDRLWTHADLDEHKQRQRAFLNQIDPLFFQVDDLVAVHARVLRDGSARPYLVELLRRLVRANANIAAEVRDADDGMWFAVETSQYVEAQGGYSELGTRYAMHGIHGLADSELRLHIGRARYIYNRGVDLAVGRKARHDLAGTILETGFIIVLAVVCAPLGAVAAGAIVGMASLGFAARDVLNAADREELYRSLEDPEAVLSWQEVQLEWMMATLSVAFSIFDVAAVGRAVRAGVVPLKSAVRGGTRETIRLEYQKVLRNLAEGALEHAIRQAATDVVMQVIMSELMPVVLAPVIAEVGQRAAVEHGLDVDVSGILETSGIDVSMISADPDSREAIDSMREADTAFAAEESGTR